MGEHRIKLVKMDAQRLLFLDDTFDAVVGMFLFCSVERPVKVARKIKRVLKPGGRFVALGYHSGRQPDGQ
jgi:ubiquinone/menaquinone biosynthesis C-methylase UbiE